MFIPRYVAFVLAAAACFPALAGVVDDAVKLAAGGVSLDVQLAWANRQKNFELTARDIIALKDAQVPDEVVVTLVRGSAANSTAEVENRNDTRESVPARYVEREVIRERPTTTYVSVPSASYASYYDYGYSSPRYYYSYPRYSYYPRYYSSYYYRPYRYYSYPRYSFYGSYGGYRHHYHRHRHHHHRGGSFGFGFRF
jgi:hypothetical protein